MKLIFKPGQAVSAQLAKAPHNFVSFILVKASDSVDSHAHLLIAVVEELADDQAVQDLAVADRISGDEGWLTGQRKKPLRGRLKRATKKMPEAGS